MAIAYKATSELNRQALIRAGLSEGQATIYEALIHYGPQKATKLAFLAGVPRTLSYKYLEELQGLGLVTKHDEPKKVSMFSPAHPIKLKELAERRLEDAKAAKSLADEALPGLVSSFDAVLGSRQESELYAQVALYAGKASLGPLNDSERDSMKKALESLLSSLTK